MDYSKLTPEIFNAPVDSLSKLAALFPSAVKDGEVDFAALREELGQFEEVGAEKYELTWAGKQAAKKLSQTDVPGRTLKYIPEDSKNADTTQNLYIEGDNLEVLKLLRQNYYGAVKMIYIDPPYNTGNDFVYRDNFTQSQAESDEAEGETIDGERMVVNQKSGNRFHANWLNMIYPRLRVAKDILRDDGVIFISIDDNEAHNLRKACEEVFGAENFVAEIPWIKRVSPANDSKWYSGDHEYLVLYAKSKELWYPKKTQRTEEHNSYYKNPDNDPRGDWNSAAYTCNKSRSERPNLYYPIINPNTGEEIYPSESAVWAYSYETHLENVKNNLLYWGADGKSKSPRRKKFLTEAEAVVPRSHWHYSEVGSTQTATTDLRDLFNGAAFPYPKTVKLLYKAIYQATNDGDIILDFFSGSATTAHAVMQLNADDNGNRRFILVQYPEVCDDKSEAAKAGYPNICEIGKERIRRAGDKIKAEIDEFNEATIYDVTSEENIQTLIDISEDEILNTIKTMPVAKLSPKQVPDIGFKVFRVADTNIRWTHEALSGGQMTVNENMLSEKDALDFMPGYNDIDVVYEVLLRQRDIPLSSKVEKLDIGSRTYMFADAYVVCLDDTITVELVEALAAVEPTPIKYVFRDSAFDDNISLKDETIRRLEAYIARNSGEQKKAYTVEFI